MDPIEIKDPADCPIMPFNPATDMPLAVSGDSAIVRLQGSSVAQLDGNGTLSVGARGTDARLLAKSQTGAIVAELFGYDGLGGHVGTLSAHPFKIRVNDSDVAQFDLDGGASLFGYTGVGQVKEPGVALSVKGLFQIRNANASIGMKSTNGGVDEKWWDLSCDSLSSALQLRALNDGYSAANAVFTVQRSGYAITGIFLGATLVPSGNNIYDLGGPSLLWANIRAANPSIVTSDEKQKTLRGDDGALTDAELDLWAEMRIVAYRMNDAIAIKGVEHARTHFGWIAQRLEEACARYGVNTDKVAPFCRDDVTRKEQVTVRRLVHVVDDVEQPYTETEVREGVPVRLLKVKMVSVPRVISTPMVDENGAPIIRQVRVFGEDGAPVMIDVPEMFDVPVMDEQDVAEEQDVPDGVRYGLRYDECLVWEAAWSRREHARHTAAILALEQRVAALEVPQPAA